MQKCLKINFTFIYHLQRYRVGSQLYIQNDHLCGAEHNVVFWHHLRCQYGGNFLEDF